MAPPNPPSAKVIIDRPTLAKNGSRHGRHVIQPNEARAAARAAGVLERRDHGEGRDQAGEHDGVGRERVDQLPAAGNAGVGELVVEADRRREQDELHEHDPRDGVAEQLAAGDARDHRVPEHIGGHEPEIGERVPEPPEVGARHDRIDALDETQRPRQDDHHDFHGQAGGGQHPDGHRGDHAVRRQRHPIARVRPSPRAIAGDHDAAPDPGSDDEQRGADVERGMRQQRRVERVEHRARARQDGGGRHQRADDRDPESRPRPGRAGDAPERRVGHQVARAP